MASCGVNSDKRGHVDTLWISGAHPRPLVASKPSDKWGEPPGSTKNPPGTRIHPVPRVPRVPARRMSTEMRLSVLDSWCNCPSRATHNCEKLRQCLLSIIKNAFPKRERFKTSLNLCFHTVSCKFP